MFDDTIQIKNPYSFREHERSAITKAIGKAYAVEITAWYTDWQHVNGLSTDMAIDKVVMPRATKTQRKHVTQALLMLMQAHINMHHEAKSFATPEEIPA